MESYGKVIKRLRKNEWVVHNPSLQERKKEFQKLLQWAGAEDIQLNVCAIEGFNRSRCIDGELF
jgi:hypothetical protein